MKARAAAVLVVMSLLAIACTDEPLSESKPLSRGSGDPSSETTADGDGTQVAVTTTTIEPGTPLAEVALDVPEWPAPTVELLDPGAEPHRELRFTPQEGAQMHLRTWGSYEHRAVADSIEQSLVIPSTETDHTTTVVATDGDRFVLDDHFVDYRLPDADSMDRASTVYIRSGLNSELGTTERKMVTTSGVVMNAGRLSPGGSLMNAIDPSESFPLPAEPFGVGARWRVTYSVVRDGSAADNDGTFEVIEIHDDRVVARFENRLAVPIDFAPEQGVEFVSTDLSTTGTVTWVLWAGVVLTDMVTTGSYVLRETSAIPHIDITVDQRAVTRITQRDPEQ